MGLVMMTREAHGLERINGFNQTLARIFML